MANRMHISRRVRSIGPYFRSAFREKVMFFNGAGRAGIDNPEAGTGIVIITGSVVTLGANTSSHTIFSGDFVRFRHLSENDGQAPLGLQLNIERADGSNFGGPRLAGPFQPGEQIDFKVTIDQNVDVGGGKSGRITIEANGQTSITDNNNANNFENPTVSVIAASAYQGAANTARFTGPIWGMTINNQGDGYQRSWPGEDGTGTKWREVGGDPLQQCTLVNTNESDWKTKPGEP